MTRKFARIVLIGVACIAVLGVAYWQYMERIANPRVVLELIENPDGERAMRVLLLRLPSGRQIPVNYIRITRSPEAGETGDQEIAYVAADGGWWSELAESEHPVTVLIRGETRSGMARAILDDAEKTKRVFAQLRPDAVEGFGRLIEIQLESKSSTQPSRTRLRTDP